MVIISAGCTLDREPAFYELMYGTTREVPMTNRIAEDHIEDDVRRVPAAINRCGGKFLAFNGQIIHGGEAAYFSASDQSTIECVKRSLPQARVDAAPASLIGKLRHRQSAPADGR